MNEEALTKIIRARIKMIMRQPFYGTLALRLRLVEDDTLNPATLATDGKRLLYHPQWVMDNDLDIVMSGVAHEVNHCVLDHIGRRNGREPGRWNQAGDYVGNAILKDSGFPLGEGWLYSPAFANMSTDEVYKALPPLPPGKGGGGAFDQHFDALPQDVDPAMHKDDWEVAAVQAANAAQAQGTLPDSLKRFIDEIVAPKADWRSVLRRFMTDAAKEDYSYARLNRRFAALGIYLPGLYSEAMGELVTVVDTSGSISRAMFTALMSEVEEIRAQLKPEALHIIQCDAAVGKVDKIERDDGFDISDIEATGGGGTDFCPPFDYVHSNGIAPKAFVYLTDGYGRFPSQPPPYPVLWLMTTDVTPPWGETVRIEL